MRFLADMGVSGRVVEHLRELGLQRLPDADVFRRATVERRIVLTFDLDFGEIAARATEPWTSVVVFRLANTMSAHVAHRLDVALARSGDALDKGAVVVVEEARCRIRALPIGRTG